MHKVLQPFQTAHRRFAPGDLIAKGDFIAGGLTFDRAVEKGWVDPKEFDPNEASRATEASPAADAAPTRRSSNKPSAQVDA